MCNFISFIHKKSIDRFVFALLPAGK